MRPVCFCNGTVWIGRLGLGVGLTPVRFVEKVGKDLGFCSLVACDNVIIKVEMGYSINVSLACDGLECGELRSDQLLRL